MSRVFAKTKILATIGPAVDTKEKLEGLIDAGCNAFRLNFSHGNFEYFEKVFLSINDLCVSRSLPIPILIDLQGPKIRIGELEAPEINLVKGDKIEVTTDKVIGNASRISTSYSLLPSDAEVGDKILIDDGLIHLKVVSRQKKSVMCQVIEGGKLKPKKGMNLPGMKLSAPSVTEKDLENLEFALKHRVDFVALSFVRTAQDIMQLKKWIAERGFDIPLIAKIEKPEAVSNFESILHAADGIMVARGDLGVELKSYEVPIIQKRIIKRCNEVGKLVITATQMLESMVTNPVPTRAEASDVANAVWDGTDVVMLSAETSVGKYPAQAVKLMNEIIINAERAYEFEKEINFAKPEYIDENLFDSMNKGICSISKQINAKVIVAFTEKGNTPNSLSKFRPQALIVAVSNSFETMNKLSLKWGVISLHCKDISDRHNAAKIVHRMLLEKEIVDKGDLVIFTEGGLKIKNARENWIRFEVV
ncbi:MAG: pyruvate kinase [Ignavibacteria bacterium]|nr:MAG: pyruvate kinase [Ignavibacteria bacterium]KAF0161573.1 MAG: pyruvate kinase [Ignavibacteria bacterium]